jgi:hypothetical protein
MGRFIANLQVDSKRFYGWITSRFTGRVPSRFAGGFMVDSQAGLWQIHRRVYDRFTGRFTGKF